MSVQKGVLGYCGCLEHMLVISQLIKEAKNNNNALSVVWLDLAKAYPSVPHQLIQEALEYYQVPPEVVKLVMSHMDSLRMMFTVATTPPDGKNSRRAPWQDGRSLWPSS